MSDVHSSFEAPSVSVDSLTAFTPRRIPDELAWALLAVSVMVIVVAIVNAGKRERRFQSHRANVDDRLYGAETRLDALGFTVRQYTENVPSESVAVAESQGSVNTTEAPISE